MQSSTIQSLSRSIQDIQVLQISGDGFGCRTGLSSAVAMRRTWREARSGEPFLATSEGADSPKHDGVNISERAFPKYIHRLCAREISEIQPLSSILELKGVNEKPFLSTDTFYLKKLHLSKSKHK